MKQRSNIWLVARLAREAEAIVTSTCLEQFLLSPPSGVISLMRLPHPGIFNAIEKPYLPAYNILLEAQLSCRAYGNTTNSESRFFVMRDDRSALLFTRGSSTQEQAHYSVVFGKKLKRLKSYPSSGIR